jgi:trk system potassium uptake protein TrkH
VETRHRPGNRIVRKRVNATQIIPLPKPLTRTVPATSQQLARRFVAAFVVLIAIGTGLLMLPVSTESGEATPAVDALFTAVSALAVTGLVVVDTQEHWSLVGEVILLMMIQLGGLGFTVGASLLLVTLGRGNRLGTALIAQDGSPTMLIAEAVSLVKRIVRFVLVVEAVGAVALTVRFAQDRPLPEAAWHGVFHSVSAFCNAGFDLQGRYLSVIGYSESIWVLGTLMVLIQAGALSYIVLEDAWTRRSWRIMRLDTKLVLVSNAILLALGALVFLVAEADAALIDVPTWAKPMNALFQSVSARTAGYASVNLGEARDATLFLWIGVMLIGGASGSTAGGVKMTTVAIVVLAIFSTIRGQHQTQIAGRRIPSGQIFLAVAVIAIFVIAHFALTLLLAVVESTMGASDLRFLAVMFETMSAAATVGISTGITPELSSPGKIILCIAMFFGRLGPLTLAYALTRHRQPARYLLAEEPVRIG